MAIERTSFKVSERAVISFILNSPTEFSQIESQLQEGYFTDLSYKILYGVAKNLFDSQQEWTWQRVADIVLGLDDVPVELRNPISFISELVSESFLGEDIEQHIKVLREREIRNSLIAGLDKLKEKASDSSLSVEDLFSESRELDNCFSDIEFEKPVVVDSSNFWQTLQVDLIELSKTKFVGTGYTLIDQYLTFGLAPGQVSVIAGRPSTGKSTFRANIQKNLSDVGIHSITISIEQKLLEEYLRLICIESGISISDIIIGWRKAMEGEDYEDFDGDRFAAAVRKFSTNWPHRLVDPKGVSFYLKDVEREIISCKKAGYDTKVVFIDLFSQLTEITRVSESGKKAGVIEQKIIEAISIAKRNDVHICCIAQLNRGSTKSNTYMSKRGDYKGSGGYEEKADLSFQVSRPHLYKPTEVVDDRIEILIDKQRLGVASKIISLQWDPNRLLIIDRHPEDCEDSDADDTGALY